MGQETKSQTGTKADKENETGQTGAEAGSGRVTECHTKAEMEAKFEPQDMFSKKALLLYKLLDLKKNAKMHPQKFATKTHHG